MQTYRNGNDQFFYVENIYIPFFLRNLLFLIKYVFVIVCFQYLIIMCACYYYDRYYYIISNIFYVYFTVFLCCLLFIRYLYNFYTAYFIQSPPFFSFQQLLLSLRSIYMLLQQAVVQNVPTAGYAIKRFCNLLQLAMHCMHRYHAPFFNLNNLARLF